MTVDGGDMEFCTVWIWSLGPGWRRYDWGSDVTGPFVDTQIRIDFFDRGSSYRPFGGAKGRRRRGIVQCRLCSRKQGGLLCKSDG